MVSVTKQLEWQGGEIGEKTPGEDVHQQRVATRHVLRQLNIDIDTGLLHLTPSLLCTHTATQKSESTPVCCTCLTSSHIATKTLASTQITDKEVIF